ncbi:MAG: FUSC family protein [Acidobacteriaceae bacterium]
MVQTIRWWQTAVSRLQWKQGLKTALAAGFCYWTTRRLGLAEGYWAAISAIVVMQSEVGATITASRDRLVGTTIGAIVAWATTFFWAQHVYAYATAILLAMLLCGLLGLQNAGRLAGVTVTIIVLIHHTGPAWKVALSRFMEVSMGIIVGLIISLTIWPSPRKPA